MPVIRRCLSEFTGLLLPELREPLLFSLLGSQRSKTQRLYLFHLLTLFSLSLPRPSDILLTHNCGSPPPIAGINPHLRPPRHTVCSPTMHLSSKTFPDTFGLLSITYLSLPLQPLFLSAGLPMALHRPVSFALPLSFSNSLNFPFLSLHSATACPTKVSPNLPQSPFDIKWRQRNRPITSPRGHTAQNGSDTSGLVQISGRKSLTLIIRGQISATEFCIWIKFS